MLWCFSFINGETIIVSASVCFSVTGFSWFTFKSMDKQPSFKGKEFMWSEEANFFFSSCTFIIYHTRVPWNFGLCLVHLVTRAAGHTSSWLTCCPWERASVGLVLETLQMDTLAVSKGHMLWPPLPTLLKGLCFLGLGRLNWIHLISKD